MPVISCRLVFLISAFATLSVKDRPAKLYFLRMGLSAPGYWLGNWLVDVLVVTVLVSVGFALVMALQVSCTFCAWD